MQPGPRGLHIHHAYLADFIILIYHDYMQISFFTAHKNIYIILRVKLATRKSLNTGCGYIPLSRHDSTCAQMACHENLTDFYTLMIDQLFYAYGLFCFDVYDSAPYTHLIYLVTHKLLSL